MSHFFTEGAEVVVVVNTKLAPTWFVGVLGGKA